MRKLEYSCSICKDKKATHVLAIKRGRSTRLRVSGNVKDYYLAQIGTRFHKMVSSHPNKYTISLYSCKTCTLEKVSKLDGIIHEER